MSMEVYRTGEAYWTNKQHTFEHHTFEAEQKQNKCQTIRTQV